MNKLKCVIVFLTGIILMSTTLNIKVQATEENNEEEIVFVVSDNEVIETDEYEEVNSIVSEKAAEALVIQNFIAEIEDPKIQYEMYLQMLDQYSEWLDRPESIEDYYSEEEIYKIERMVETEVHGGDFSSKVNVACVVFNRIDSEQFPDEVDEVIKPGQFAYSKTDISDDTKLAVLYAFQFGDTTQGALFFHSGEFTNTFNGATHIMTDQVGHHFYG